MTHASISAEERAALGISDTLIRLSIGLEDVGDLIADLDQALRTAVGLASTNLVPAELEQEILFVAHLLFLGCLGNRQPREALTVWSHVAVSLTVQRSTISIKPSGSRLVV